MASEIENWQTAMEFLSVAVVIEHAFRCAYRTGHSPYGEYALVQMDATHVLCAQRNAYGVSLSFMTKAEAVLFARNFERNFFQAFRF